MGTYSDAVHGDSAFNSRVLIIGPGTPIAQDVVQSAFTRRGHAIAFASTEDSSAYNLDQYDLLILELDAGDANALGVCAQLRQRTLTPLLVLVPMTARSQGLRALEMGADTYVVVPFDRRELVARSEALLRRHRRH